MTNLDTIAKLDDYEDEDIFDVVVKLEKSFGLQFEKNAFYDVNTFGDLCDVFENHVGLEHRDDCTKQQAFYRVRDTIVSTLQISRDTIKLDTKLSELFPSPKRRQNLRRFKIAIGIDIKILTCPDWLALTLVIGLAVSLIALFFNWKIALTGIVFFISALKIVENLGNTLKFRTVRELTNKLAREHYMQVRRFKGTFNRQELLQTIIDTFSYDLDIEKSNLTREAIFSWTKSNNTNGE